MSVSVCLLPEREREGAGMSHVRRGLLWVGAVCGSDAWEAGGCLPERCRLALAAPPWLAVLIATLIAICAVACQVVPAHLRVAAQPQQQT